MENDWKKRLGVVYSTNENFKFETESSEESETLPNKQQNLIVSLDKKNRKGKSVTLINGFKGMNEDLIALGKQLKNKCGVGGTVKDNRIMLQGDHRSKVLTILKEAGYIAKISGS